MHTSGFNPRLHGLRGAAALAVLFFHWFLTFPGTLNHYGDSSLLGSTLRFGATFGWVGVLLFFVLSGYLLGGRLLRTPLTRDNCQYFWLRRGCRIYPAVWAQYAVLLILIAVGVKGFTLPSSWLDGILNFFLLINIPPILPRAINLVWWTLPIELTFYLALPALTWLMRRFGWLAFGLSMLVLSISWRSLIMYLNRDLPSYNPVHPIIDLLPGALFSFVVGMCLTALPAPAARLHKHLWLVAGFAGVTALCGWMYQHLDTYWTGHWMLAIWNPLASIPLGMMVYACLGTTDRSGVLGSRPAVWLGEVSYGIYLWHFPVLVVIKTYLPEWKQSPSYGILALGIIIAGTLVLAPLSYHLVEKPSMLWKRKGSNSA